MPRQEWEFGDAYVSPAPTSAATHEEPRHRAVARYLWAMLLARIYEASH